MLHETTKNNMISICNAYLKRTTTRFQVVGKRLDFPKRFLPIDLAIRRHWNGCLEAIDVGQPWLDLIPQSSLIHSAPYPPRPKVREFQIFDITNGDYFFLGHFRSSSMASHIMSSAFGFMSVWIGGSWHIKVIIYFHLELRRWYRSRAFLRFYII